MELYLSLHTTTLSLRHMNIPIPSSTIGVQLIVMIKQSFSAVAYVTV
jgi:hypothetical protein